MLQVKQIMNRIVGSQMTKVAKWNLKLITQQVLKHSLLNHAGASP